MKPNFPNPGNGRYWQVSQDMDGDFILTLRNSGSARIIEDLIDADYISTKSLEALATTLLTRVSNKELYVGSYIFEENI